MTSSPTSSVSIAKGLLVHMVVNGQMEEERRKQALSEQESQAKVMNHDKPSVLSEQNDDVIHTLQKNSDFQYNPPLPQNSGQ